MKRSDILEIHIKNNDAIKLDLARAENLIKMNKFEKAAEKYKEVAKHFIKLHLYNFAIDYFLKSSFLFKEAQNYLKAVNQLKSIGEIYAISGDVRKQAQMYEKIAAWNKHYLKNNSEAGTYYYLAAKLFEEDQNYIAAFKKAKFAYECFETQNNNRRFIDALGLATRMALQARFLERAGNTLLKWRDNIDKNYSSHHLSICMKGYKSFVNAGKLNEASVFLNDIIESHYNGNPQENIEDYLMDAQRFSLITSKEINQKIHERIIDFFHLDYDSVIKYCLEMRKYSDEQGLRDISDNFFIIENNFRIKKYIAERRIIKAIFYSLWKYSSNFGISAKRWFSISFLIFTAFGIIYASYPVANYLPKSIQDFIISIKAEIAIDSLNNWFAPYYFSIVTFTTLGFGDITPLNLAAQLYIVIEVILGYLMLGGLITIFFRKFIR